MYVPPSDEQGNKLRGAVTPSPLLPTAPTDPAVCVPWLESSVTSEYSGVLMSGGSQLRLGSGSG